MSEERSGPPGAGSEPLPAESVMRGNEETLEELFGALAVKLGYITTGVLGEALAEQKRLKEGGETIRVGQILLKKGILTLTQFLEVLKLQERAVMTCPQCGRVYNFQGQPSEATLLCLRCGAKLTSPQDPKLVMQEQQKMTPYQTAAYKPGQVSLGKYRLIREVARGGMGVVYEAEDPDLRRRVALKMLKEGEAGISVVQRLHREAALAARLHHPNIIAIHEVGAVRDREGSLVHFICMDYVEGETLQDAMRVKKYPIREFVAIVEQVSRAVHYAHGEGVIHRDLKPANILIDRSSRPVVTDFGLAKQEDEQATRLTRSGAVMGTPLYMAPEQVEGKGGEIDRRTDVYALGVTLYEGLTGKAPFTGDTAVEVYRKIVEEEPLRPRKVNTHLDNDLETIVLRAMAKERERRYPDAGALAEDLKKYLAGERISARPPSTFYEIRRHLQKRKLVVGMSALLMLAVGGGSWMWWDSGQRQEMRDRVGEMEEQTRLLYQEGLPSAEEMRKDARAVIGELEEYRRKFPRESRIAVALTRARRLLAEDEASELDLKKALEQDSENGLLHFELARIYLDRMGLLVMQRVSTAGGRVLDTIQAEKKAGEQFREHLSAARKFSGSLGRMEEQVTRFQEKLLSQPNREELEKVVEEVTPAINGGGATAPWLRIRADAYSKMAVSMRGTPDEKMFGERCVQDLMAAVGREPSLPSLRFRLVLAQADRSVRDIESEAGAVEQLARLIRLCPDWTYTAEIYLWKSHLLSLVGRFEEALRDVEEALRRKPGHSWALYHHGRLRAGMKDLDRAEMLLREAIEADEANPYSSWWLGDVLFLKRQDNEALEQYDRTNEILRKEMIARGEVPPRIVSGAAFGRAQIFLRQGKDGEVVENLLAANESDRQQKVPEGNPVHWFLMGEVHRRNRRFPEALEAYQKSFGLGKRDARLADEVLWMFMQRYDAEPERRGMVWQERVNEKWARVYYAMGLCQEALGQKTEAKEALKRAYELDPSEDYRKRVPPNP